MSEQVQAMVSVDEYVRAAQGDEAWHEGKQDLVRRLFEDAMAARRQKLPEDRVGKTMHFTILSRTNEQPDGTAEVQEGKGYLTANVYPDSNKLGEIFVRVGKAGSTEALLDMWAMSCSIALQRGATVDELFGKFVGQRFEPSGKVKWVDGVTSCSSIVDMVSRYLIKRFGTEVQA